MKKIYITTLLLSCSLLLAAQTQFGGAILFADFSELNDDLLANDFPAVDDDVFSFSIISAKQKLDSKWVNRFGFMFNLYDKDRPSDIAAAPTNQVNELNWRTLGLIFGEGYNFISKKHITFGPSADVILVQNRIRLLENLPSNLTFGNILAADSQSEEFKNVKVMFQGNLNLLFHFNHKQSKTQYGIGLTGGYRWDPFDPEWRYEESDVKLDIEGTQHSGFMLGLMLTIKGPDFMPQKQNSKKERS